MSSDNATTPRDGKIPEDIAAEWYSMAEACEKMKVSRYTIWRLTREGILVSNAYGRLTLISKASVLKYLNRNIAGPAKTTSGKRKVKAAPKKTPKAKP